MYAKIYWIDHLAVSIVKPHIVIFISIAKKQEKHVALWVFRYNALMQQLNILKN